MEVPCPECKGEGVLNFAPYADPVEDIRTCYTCKGEKIIEVEEED
jgi:DnaJ-class molecular chaperone